MPSHHRKPSTAFLVAAAATGPLALNMLVPSMPGLPTVFDAEPATVQLTLSLYLAGVAVGQLVLGPLSDRFGRRPVLLAGLAAYTLASVACALAPTIGTLVLGRVVQAAGGCAGMVVARAIVRDAWSCDEATRMLALVIAGVAAAPMVAPAIGGFIDLWLGWRASFGLLMLFGGSVWLAGLLTLPETHRHPTPLPSLAALAWAYGSLAARPIFLGHALLTSLANAAFFCFVAGAPFIMVDALGRSPSEYGLLFALLSLGYMAGNTVVSRLARLLPAGRLIAGGLGLSLSGPGVLVGVVLADALTPLTLFLPAVLLTFGHGLLMSPAMTAAIGADPRLSGTASGLVGFLQMGFGALASSLVISMQDDRALAMAVGMLIANAGAVFALLHARRVRAP